jgi:hypothetical protein
MNIPSDISKHIEEQAEIKAKKRAIEATKLLAEEITTSGDLTVPAPNGGVITLNGPWLEQLQASIVNASRDRLQKEELETFIAESEELVLQRLKEKKTK